MWHCLYPCQYQYFEREIVSIVLLNSKNLSLPAFPLSSNIKTLSQYAIKIVWQDLLFINTCCLLHRIVLPLDISWGLCSFLCSYFIPSLIIWNVCHTLTSIKHTYTGKWIASMWFRISLKWLALSPFYLFFYKFLLKKGCLPSIY